MSSPRQPIRQRLASLLAASAMIIAALGLETAPAQASSDKALKLLLGVTAVAIIAHSASRSHATPPKRYDQHHHATPPKYYRQDPRQGRILPHQCRARYVFRGNRYSGYVGSCLHQHGVRHVPQACHLSHHGGHIYSASCLSRHGYRRG